MTLFNDLLQKFIRDELTGVELEEFLQLVREPANAIVLDAALREQLEAVDFPDLTAGMDIEQQFREVLMKAGSERSVVDMDPVEVKRTNYLFRWISAASVVLVLAGVLAWWKFAGTESQTVFVSPSDIAPGTSGAILTLADGTKVVLDSLSNGLVATQSGTRVELIDGRLSYLTNKSSEVAPVYNTMSTPKGRQFQLRLPDGTGVWLNAASSIQYPIAFTNGERRVIVTGEAYFEVAQDARKPFIVELNNIAEVEVLGTHFNIDGYMDEGAAITTLLQGAVRVRAVNRSIATDDVAGNGQLLRPGQQGLVKPAGAGQAQMLVQHADIEKVMAWKNGYFNFEGASIRQVMKQLERWYDISVVYENGVPDVMFFGEMSRNVNLGELLLALQEMKLGVNIRLDSGRKLILSP
ncbi:FecR family protein [Pseudoflavitalea rhizosphaerae]|uniref:FecR family protein n=1 Tax=Pseudoflavitalea rhizosphaerae TaxID=1884793 RepID=UPI000F8C80CE|nr:FecR family protein [Pseudoflavitalea rhizosphaerae]